MSWLLSLHEERLGRGGGRPGAEATSAIAGIGEDEEWESESDGAVLWRLPAIGKLLVSECVAVVLSRASDAIDIAPPTAFWCLLEWGYREYSPRPIDEIYCIISSYILERKLSHSLNLNLR